MGNKNRAAAIGKPAQKADFLCLPCLMAGVVRQAWTVSEGRACCIRHAVEDSDLDDMDQHDLFVVIYEALRRLGHADPY
jgi:hypothetical protein